MSAPGERIPTPQEMVRDFAIANQSLTDRVADLELAVEFWRTSHAQAVAGDTTLKHGVQVLRDHYGALAAHGRNDGWPQLVAASTVATALTRLFAAEEARDV